ncbi:MAG TPA: hypothetical protein VH257_24140 [Chloroflexota bacterium]|nr:hypothetical protein [Chloroflexota bacterium]
MWHRPNTITPPRSGADVEYGRLSGGYLHAGGERFDQVLLEQPVTEEVIFSPAAEGRTRVDLLGGGRSLAHVEIEPLILRYGLATHFPQRRPYLHQLDR